MKKLFTTSVMLGCILFYATAQVIHIPGDKLTIQAGIDSASTGDTVLVQEGTWYENINFKGKAIIVASLFIMDGDTSHISKTIIDGSQATHPDSASVVTICSGEDTTSVLMGFTITGGNVIKPNGIAGGAGINIHHAGAKIVYNIIEDNHLQNTGDDWFNDYNVGAGIFVWCIGNHTAVVLNNIIRNNMVTGHQWAYGAGAYLGHGTIIFEHNYILNNSAVNEGPCLGAGLCWGYVGGNDTVNANIYIRNNYICGNSAQTGPEDYGGGGVAIIYGSYDIFDFSNNIICDNYTSATGGGMYIINISNLTFNGNTFYNNRNASGYMREIELHGQNIKFFNNIVWSDQETDSSCFGFDGSLYAFNNILSEPIAKLNEQAQLDTIYNMYKDPLFLPDTFLLSQNSPAIGWGRDSIKLKNTWYYAPTLDFFGNKRPDPVDLYMDAGAVESEFPRPVYHNANIIYIGLMSHHKLMPDIHEDIQHYTMRVPDTTIVTPQLIVRPADWSAKVDINEAGSILSEDPAERTTTITVTAADGYTQVIYTVQFEYMDTITTFSNLSLSKGTLIPEFNPDSLKYTVCLPRLETKTPVVTCETTDTYASFFIDYAKDIQSLYKPFRTTIITVTAEDGIRQREYEIEHLIDKTIPSITHSSATVMLPDSIEVTSNEDGCIYLVPVNTSKNLESIMANRIDSTIDTAGDIAYIDTEITGTYWLYAIDNCLNISSPVAVNIIIDGISENLAETICLYPIPVDQILYIETIETILSVELFNVVGVKIMEESKFEGRIDMGHLEQGIYFIRIRTEKGEVYTGKVVKR